MSTLETLCLNLKRRHPLEIPNAIKFLNAERGQKSHLATTIPNIISDPDFIRIANQYRLNEDTKARITQWLTEDKPEFTEYIDDDEPAETSIGGERTWGGDVRSRRIKSAYDPMTKTVEPVPISKSTISRVTTAMKEADKMTLADLMVTSRIKSAEKAKKKELDPDFTLDMKILKPASALNDIIYYYNQDTGISLGELQNMLKQGTKISDIREKYSKAAWRDIPKFDKVPQKADHATMKEVLQKAHIPTILRPNEVIKLPPLKPASVVFKEANNELEQMIAEDNDMRVPSIFDNPNNKSNYKPKFEIVKPSYLIISHARLLYQETKEQRYDDLTHALADIMRTHYYGNGSLHGMLGRHKAVNNVYQELSGFNSILPENTKDMWKKNIKLNPVNQYSSLISDRFTTTIHEFFKKNITTNKVNLKADSGMVWANKKKEETLMYDLHTADSIIMLLRTITGDELLACMPWMRLVTMKPKGEVYERSEYETKTRNIYVLYSAPMYILQFFMYLPHHHMPDFRVDKTQKSMLGFSPFKGGVDWFIRQIRERRPFVYPYSDNLYAFEQRADGSWVFISADGAKFEASITEAEVMAYNQFLCDSWGLDPENPKHTPYIRFMMSVAPKLTIGTIGCLGEYQLRVNGMASGSVGTAYYNTAKMMRLVNEVEVGKIKLLSSQNSKDFSKTFIAATKRVGVKMTLEHASVFPSDARTPLPSFIKLDMLGFDALQSWHDQNVYLPILDERRLLKALCFPRNDFTVHHEHSTAKTLEFVRLKALYMMGGWAYESIAITMRSAMESMKVDLVDEITSKDAEIILNSLDDVLGEMGLLESLKGFLLLDTIPSIYDIYAVGTSEDIANQMLIMLYDKLKDGTVDEMDTIIKAMMPQSIKNMVKEGDVTFEQYKHILSESYVHPTESLDIVGISADEMVNLFPGVPLDNDSKIGYTELTNPVKQEKTILKNERITPYQRTTNEPSRDLLDYFSKVEVFKFNIDVTDPLLARKLIAKRISSMLSVSMDTVLSKMAGDKRLSTTEGPDLLETIKSFKVDNG